MIVYKLENLINGKCYVGQTRRSLEQRIKEHNKSNSPIGYAIRKYGLENFSKEILAECETLEEMNKLERYWIAKLNCKFPNGYNCMNGGDGQNTVIPKEIRQKMSEAHKGKKASEATKKKMSEARKGLRKNCKFSAEARQRMSEGQKGKKHSEKTKAKMSAAHKGKKKSDSTRAKMSEYAKNRTPEHKAKLLEKQIGKIIPQETREKLSESMKRFQECKRKEREKINSDK